MSRFSLYLEEDSQDRDLEAALRRVGMYVQRCASLGMNGKSDEEQLAFAAERGLVLYTANSRDFVRLHFEYLEAGTGHACIIFQAERRWSIGEQARRITRIWESRSAEDMRNNVESVNQWGAQDS